MTVRDLINSGVNIDAEICVSVKVYNENGEYVGNFYNYSSDTCLLDNDIETICISANVENVV